MANPVPTPIVTYYNLPPGTVRYQQLPDPLLFPVWYDGYGYVTQSPGYGFPRIDPPQQQQAAQNAQKKKEPIIALIAFGCFLFIAAIIAIVILNTHFPQSGGAIGFSVASGLFGLLGLFSIGLGFNCCDSEPVQNPDSLRDPRASWQPRIGEA